MDEIEEDDKEFNEIKKGTKKKKSKTIIKPKHIFFKKLKERMDPKEIEGTQNLSFSLKRRNYKAAKSLKICNENHKEKMKKDLYVEESKSDDEDNIKENKINIKEEENGTRKTIFKDSIGSFESSNNDDVPSLEEKWKYEKILLDYNIIDFTSK